MKTYNSEKLKDAVASLRKLTQSPLATVVPEVRHILADAGVALVVMPIMKQSAFRGCTRLLSPSKAVIIHSLKYRNVSQFWLILFHEIAHLILHISNVEDVFAEYDDQAAQPPDEGRIHDGADLPRRLPAPRRGGQPYLDRESHYLWGKRYLLKLTEKDAVPEIHHKHRTLLLQLRPGATGRISNAVPARGSGISTLSPPYPVSLFPGI